VHMSFSLNRQAIRSVTHDVIAHFRPANFIRKLYYEPKRPLAKLFVNIMANEILKNRPPYGHINDSVSFAFNYRSKLFRVFKVFPYKPELAPFTIIPAQIPYEILALLEILAKLRPQRILEIGTERGGTLFLWTYVAAKNAMIISIDVPPECFLFRYSYPYWKEDLYRSFSFFNQKIYPIRGFSQQPSTLKKVMDILATGKLDFLFIDGDHTYEGLRRTSKCTFL